LKAATTPPRSIAAARTRTREQSADFSPSKSDTGTDPQRSSLESLVELEQLLEEQHRQLIEKGFIPPTHQWISADLGASPAKGDLA